MGYHVTRADALPFETRSETLIFIILPQKKQIKRQKKQNDQELFLVVEDGCGF